MKLRATKYLPDIVHLQQYFHERYTPQILYKKIAGKTVGHFLNDSGGWYPCVLCDMNTLGFYFIPFYYCLMLLI